MSQVRVQTLERVNLEVPTRKLSSVVVETEQYEKLSVARRILDFVWLPIMWLLAFLKPVGVFFVKLSTPGRLIRRFSASYKALELIYTYSWDSSAGRSWIDRIFSCIWLNIRSAKGTRNRLKLVKKLITEATLSLGKSQVNVISLGAGSARAIVEVAAELRAKDTTLWGKLVDRSQQAVLCSKDLAQELGVFEQVTWAKKRIEDWVDSCNGFEPDIIEMVGIMDYLNNKEAQELVGRIFEIMSNGSYFLVGNIRKNPDRIFLTRVVNWPMIYRDAEDLLKILEVAGFSKTHCHTLYEPLKIHTVILAQKVS